MESKAAKLAFSPKRALAELRHSSSVGSRASSSPMKRDEDSSPLFAENQPDDDDRHTSRERERSFWSYLQLTCPYFSEESRFSLFFTRTSLLILFIVIITGLFSISSIWKSLVSAFGISFVICCFFIFIPEFVHQNVYHPFGCLGKT